MSRTTSTVFCQVRESILARKMSELKGKNTSRKRCQIGQFSPARTAHSNT